MFSLNLLQVFGILYRKLNKYTHERVRIILIFFLFLLKFAIYLTFVHLRFSPEKTLIAILREIFYLYLIHGKKMDKKDKICLLFLKKRIEKSA